MRRALIVGVWDLFHHGHARILARCAELADEVVVGVNSDAFVLAYKGRPPVDGEAARRAAIEAATGFPTRLSHGPTRLLIVELRPDLLVVGSDWHARYPAHIGMTVEELDAMGVAVCYVPRTPGVSSSQLREERGL